MKKYDIADFFYESRKNQIEEINTSKLKKEKLIRFLERNISDKNLLEQIIKRLNAYEKATIEDYEKVKRQSFKVGFYVVK